MRIIESRLRFSYVDCDSARENDFVFSEKMLSRIQMSLTQKISFIASECVIYIYDDQETQKRSDTSK